MEKKNYLVPEISVVTIDSVSICAGSPTGLDGLIENGSDMSAQLGNGGTAEEADAGSAHSASRIYFDAWEEED